MRTLFLCLATLLFIGAQGQDASLQYYLGSHHNYNPEISTPEAVLGTEVGEWHVRHDQLVWYLRTLAEESDRISFLPYGRTYEDRQLFALVITSAENHANLEEIRKKHVSYALGESSDEAGPVVLYQGYTVHGDEPSGANAALLYAYHLAAAQGPEVERKLSESVILLDPCFNPDGLNRFAHWANTNKSKHVSADPSTREHRQPWPGGRTNHYWFDLNRDWLPAQHPESQGRLNLFHQWLPNILTDHHEMGTGNTYFFQPGIPSRTNPLTPQDNQNLTGEVATYHAAALDSIGSLYYTRESFDDFYYGKGSTYPDINGCIGILFEQASSRGHAQKSSYGTLTFPFTIRNQLTTSFSTWAAGLGLREDLLNFQRTFYEDAKSAAEKDAVKAIVCQAYNDPARTQAFGKMLRAHQIECYWLNENVSAGGHAYEANAALVIPTNQIRYRLLKGMLQKQTSFQDSLFYDVSAWTLPLAFGLDYDELKGGQYKASLKGETVGETLSSPAVNLPSSQIGYLIRWDDYYAPSALYALQKMGIRVRITKAESVVKPIGGESITISPGSLWIPLQLQSVNAVVISQQLKKLAAQYHCKVYAAETGLTTEGVDLGSPQFQSLRRPKVALLTGKGISAYEAGEVWHLLDQRMDIDLSLLDLENVRSINLNQYNTIVMVDGRYSGLGTSGIERLKQWTKAGGTIIAWRGALNWLGGQKISGARFSSGNDEEEDFEPHHHYADRSRASGAQVVGGCIVEIEVDPTHPLFYGYPENRLSVFRKGTSVLKEPGNQYASPAHYTADPLVSGYMSQPNQDHLKGSPAVILSSYGKGRVIGLNDNPNFRAFWWGTTRIFMNALFHGNLIDGGSLESPGGG